MKFIKKELNLAKIHWNTHMICQSKHAKPAGRPDQLQYLAEYNSYFDQLYPYDQLGINELNSCLDMVEKGKREYF